MMPNLPMNRTAPARHSLPPSRRTHVSHQLAPYQLESPPRPSRDPMLSPRCEHTKMASSFPPVGTCYRTPDQTPASEAARIDFRRTSTSSTAFERPSSRDITSPNIRAPEPNNLRRLSSYGREDGPALSHERDRNRPVSQHVDAYYPSPYRIEGPPIEQQPPQRLSNFARGPYATNETNFFVPGLYEYQHIKARKRSNLPKQSTEIMKTWFDQVCISLMTI